MFDFGKSRCDFCATFPNSCYIVPIARAASHNKSKCNG